MDTHLVHPVAAQIDMLAVYSALAHLSNTYPGFDDWYWGKVVPGVADGTRFVDVVFSNGKPVAIGISKKTATELKICTLWVSPEHRNLGHADRILQRACNWLETITPLCTISESRMEEFSALVSKWNWKISERIDNAYRMGQAEYVINGNQEIAQND